MAHALQILLIQLLDDPLKGVKVNICFSLRAAFVFSHERVSGYFLAVEELGVLAKLHELAQIHHLPLLLHPVECRPLPETLLLITVEIEQLL